MPPSRGSCRLYKPGTGESHSLITALSRGGYCCPLECGFGHHRQHLANNVIGLGVERATEFLPFGSVAIESRNAQSLSFAGSIGLLVLGVCA